MKSIKYNSFWDRVFQGQLETNRFGIIIMLLLICGCLGGSLQVFNLARNTWELALVVFPMMMLLSFILAVQPMKRIMTAAAIAIAIDLLVILYEVIF